MPTHNGGDTVNVKQFLAGVVCTILHKAHVWTRACGGWRLYSALWYVYTARGTVARTGYVMLDWKRRQ